METKRWFNNSIWVVSIIAFASFVTYFNSLTGDFQFDDEKAIVANSFIRVIANFYDLDLWLNIQKRTMSMFSFALNYLFNGYNVEGYHFINLVIHTLSGFLVYFFTLELIKTGKIKYGKQENRNLIGLFAALVFIMHPIQTQAVSYIVQRMASLATFFYLLTCFSYLKARLITNNYSLNKTALLFYIITFLAGLSAILSKQNAVTLPLMIIAIELYFVRNREGKVNYGFISFIVFTVMLAITFILPYSQLNLSETSQISRTVYFMTQILVLMKYFQLIIFPFGLNVDHHFNLVQSFGINESLSFFTCFLLIMLIFIMFKRLRLTSFVILWFFLTLSIESSFIPIKDVIAEHRVYLPMISISIFIGYLLKLLIDRNNKFLSALVVMLLFTYSGLTIARNNIWHSKVSLWEDAVKKSPFKARPYNNLGHSYLLEGEKEKAKLCFIKAIKLNSDYVEAINNLGSVYLEEEQYDSAQYFFNKTLELMPNYIPVIINQGICYRELGYLGKSSVYFKKALGLSPNNPDANFNFAYNVEQLGKLNQALLYYQRAIEFRPTFADAYYNSGNIYVKQNRMSKALEYYEKALIYNRTHIGALINSANIYFLRENYKEAKLFYNKALIVNPEHEEAKKNSDLCNQKLVLP